MKKTLLLSTLGVAIAYTGIAWYSGYVGEREFNEQYALSQQQAEFNGVRIEKTRYERGIFTSKVDIRIVPVSEANPIALVDASSRAQHGPLLFGRGIGLGLFDADSQVRIEWRDDTLPLAAQDFIATQLANSRIHTRAYFNSRYKSVIEFAAIDEKNDQLHFSMQPSLLEVRGKLDSLSGEGSIHVGAIALLNQDGSQVDINAITGEFSAVNLEPGINITNLAIHLPELASTSPAGAVFTAKDIRLAQEQSLQNDKIDTQVKLAMAKLEGPVVVENAYYQVAVNQLSKEAFKTMNSLFAQAGAATTPTTLAASYRKAFSETLPLLLQEGLAMQVALGAEFMGGKSQAEWDIRYVPPADGAPLSSYNTLDSISQLVNSSLLVSAPASLLQATPASAMLGTYVQQEGDNYVLKASFNQGELVIGNTPVPRELWLGTLASIWPSELLALAEEELQEEELQEDELLEEPLDDEQVEAAVRAALEAAEQAEQ